MTSMQHGPRSESASPSPNRRLFLDGRTPLNLYCTIMSAYRGIRLVTFDALHTLITPRAPIHVQYSNTFAPYLGVLDPDALKRSFKTGEQEVPRT